MQNKIIYGCNKNIWDGYNVGYKKSGLFPAEGKENLYKFLKNTFTTYL